MWCCIYCMHDSSGLALASLNPSASVTMMSARSSISKRPVSAEMAREAGLFVGNALVSWLLMLLFCRQGRPSTWPCVWWCRIDCSYAKGRPVWEGFEDDCQDGFGVCRVGTECGSVGVRKGVRACACGIVLGRV